MCGICGIFGISDRAKVKEMAAAMRHRGPDDEGYYVEPPVSLGFRRLGIIDLNTGNQPIPNEDKTVWVVTNGEIYNYKALREDLIKKGHRFSTQSDAEVAVHLYEEMREGCFEAFNGIFGMCIYDKTRRRILLARDRFGVKPLYYTIDKERLYFASEIKSIIRNPEIRRDLSEEALFHFMTFRYVPTPFTIYKNIYAVRPGHMLIFDGTSGVRESSYWSLSLGGENRSTEDEIAEELFFRLEKAVKLQMVSDVPIGSFLSGGVDSSFITAFVRKHYPERLSTFTLSYYENYRDKAEDERLSSLLSREWGTEHHIRRISQKDYLDVINKAVWHFDQPFSHGFSPIFISEIMKGKVKVALSGDGADEMFGSYFAHRMARPIYNYARYSKNGGIDAGLLEPCGDKLSMIKRFSRLDEYQWRMELYNMYLDDEKKDIFEPELLKRMKGMSTGDFTRDIFSRIKTADPQNRIQEYELKTLLTDQIFEFTDKLTMANSIECRVPYLENDFFAFASSIPGDLRIKKSVTKYILKKSASRILPDEVINRIPSGFQLPTNRWMRQELKEDINQTLSEERLKTHGFFRSGHIMSLLDRFYKGDDESVVYKLWNFYCFQKWYDNSYSRAGSL